MSTGLVVTFSVQVHNQVLEDVHVSRVSDGACGGGYPLAVDVGNGLSPHVQHKGIHESDVVLITRVRQYLNRQKRRD